MTPRFMEQGGGPTDPMALLMRQRIVFLGTEVRAASSRSLPQGNPTSGGELALTSPLR